MDPYQAHPPIDHAIYLFFAFTRIYYTPTQGIDFTRNIPPHSLREHYLQNSFAARRMIYNLYHFLTPLVATSPLHKRLLDTAYLSAISQIHTRFNTVQTSPPFSPPDN